MKRILLIDDIRTLRMVCGDNDPDEFRKLARTFDEGIEALDKEGPWDVLHLDHDLGPGKDGADIMLWLAEHQDKLPKEIYFVTANPDGYKRMANILKDIREGKSFTTGFRVMGSESNTRRLMEEVMHTVEYIHVLVSTVTLDALKWAKVALWDNLTNSEENNVLRNCVAEADTPTSKAEEFFAGIDQLKVYSTPWGEFSQYPAGEGDLDYRDGDDVYETKGEK